LLAPLLVKEDPALFTVALTFLQELYKHAPEVNPHELLEEMISKGKKLLEKNRQIKVLSVFDLPHPSENLRTALAGTKGYRYGNGCGYPALDDFIYLYSAKYRCPIAAPFASAPLLIALLGEKNARFIFEEEALLSEEAEVEKYLNKTEMQDLLCAKQNPLTPKKEALLGNEKFPAQRRNGKQIIVMDSNLQLEARQTLYTYQLSSAPRHKEKSKETRSIPDALM